MKKHLYLHILENFLCMVVLIAVLLLGGVGVTYAATSNYSNVLDDLRKDESFDFNDYPNVNDDYSLQVIQIAESTNGELFLYVYQPSALVKPLTATNINMALSESIDNTALFNLTLLNREGVLQKYRVDGVRVSSDEVRYYNITTISRDWVEGVDVETGNDNTFSSVAFEVGKLYKIEVVDGVINYTCQNTTVIEIENPYADFVSYYSGLTWANFFGSMSMAYKDIHYIAFSTDKRIDMLKEADVSYRTQSYTYKRGDTSYGSLSDYKLITLMGDTSVSAVGYTWKSILRASDFIEQTTKLNDAAKAIVSKSEFVLVFLTTDYSQREATDFVGHYTVKSGTKVSDVRVLRLKFETDGVVYNLGSVSDGVTGDDIPGNQEMPIGFFAYVWRCIVRFFKGTATLVEQVVAIVAIFICVILLPILLIVLSIFFPAFGAVMQIIFKAIWTVIKWLFQGLWWLLSLPFRGIAALVQKIRGD